LPAGLHVGRGVLAHIALDWVSALSGELDLELLAEESDDDSELLEEPFELAEKEQP